MAQVGRSLPLTCPSWIRFLTLGFDLVLSALVWALWGVNQNRSYLPNYLQISDKRKLNLPHPCKRGVVEENTFMWPKKSLHYCQCGYQTMQEFLLSSIRIHFYLLVNASAGCLPPSFISSFLHARNIAACVRCVS